MNNIVIKVQYGDIVSKHIFTNDIEANKFLKDLHQEKMDKACLELFNKKYTLGFIVSKNQPKSNYYKLCYYNFKVLKISITHEKQ